MIPQRSIVTKLTHVAQLLKIPKRKFVPSELPDHTGATLGRDDIQVDVNVTVTARSGNLLNLNLDDKLTNCVANPLLAKENVAGLLKRVTREVTVVVNQHVDSKQAVRKVKETLTLSLPVDVKQEMQLPAVSVDPDSSGFVDADALKVMHNPPPVQAPPPPPGLVVAPPK